MVLFYTFLENIRSDIDGFGLESKGQQYGYNVLGIIISKSFWNDYHKIEVYMEQIKLLSGREIAYKGNFPQEALDKENIDNLDQENLNQQNLEQEYIDGKNLNSENTAQEHLRQDDKNAKLADKRTLKKGTLDKKTSRKKRWFRAAGICALLTAAVVVTGALVLRKDIKVNPILAKGYEVHGVDVSHYQGTIDWDVLSQNQDFAFIKATEGSTHVDERFLDNWQAAGQTHLYLGAYHFFSFDSAGDQQAASYIETVGDLDGKLAPVVDVEYYGNKKSNPPERTEVIENLTAMLDTLEQHYEVKPIIYTTYTVYNDYIKGEFEGYPLWVRSVYCPPSVLFGNKWSFWQYMDTAMLDGYAGAEQYIDVNVFRGTRQELEKMTIQKIMY